MNTISVVVPCYYEEKSLPLFYESINKVTQTMNELKFELIFIDDGSNDRPLEILRRYAKNDSRIKYISLSRNFGKESALYAGLEYSSGIM